MPATMPNRLLSTYSEIPFEFIDEVIFWLMRQSRFYLRTLKKTWNHHDNASQEPRYGGNQKTCYKAALEHAADCVIMLHPDYQYTPKLLGRHGVSGGTASTMRFWFTDLV